MTKIIDCTLRDGGNLTNWHFDKKFVQGLYNVASLSGIDYFEAGYRNKQISSNFGDFYFCSDEFLRSIFDNRCKMSVMADVGKSDLSLFAECNNQNTLVSLVRVAVYPDNLYDAFDFCEGLKDKKYDVMLNLMSFGRYNAENIKTLKNWNNKNILTSVCFSDSFGAFMPKDVEISYNKLLDIGFENISFHSHNNLQLAFANSIKFWDMSGYSLDASVGGLGRNGGILPIELILSYIQKDNKRRTDVLPYLRFMYNNTTYFPNVDLISLICGLKNIHYKYVKNLFEQYSSIDEIWRKSDEIKENSAISYT